MQAKFACIGTGSNPFNESRMLGYKKWNTLSTNLLGSTRSESIKTTNNRPISNFNNHFGIRLRLYLLGQP